MSADLRDYDFDDAAARDVPPDEIAFIWADEPDPWWIRNRPGLCNTELPFRTDVSLSCEAALEERVKLTKNALLRDAQLALIANVVCAHFRRPGTWVFYSRDHNHYAERVRRYVPPYYSYRRMVDAVASLESRGLIEHRKTRPSPSAEYRSRIRATNHLLELPSTDAIEFFCDPREVVILRGPGGQPLDYQETNHTHAMRRDALEHNEFLSGLDIRVEHPDAQFDAHGFLHVRGGWLDPRRRHLYRVFNRFWTHGGRWYGGWWQSLPKDVRAQLLVNGETVIEHDYRACHLRLLCAQAGIDLPFHEQDFDPYAIVGFDRSHIKLAINIMLHASSERAALGAIASELSIRKLQGPRADLLISAVRKHFCGLERYWCSGIGLRLQSIDAEICRCVQRRLRYLGIPVLSVHDSFIVPVSFDSGLADVMEEEMCRACSIV
jgi:hypothetical protein